MKAYMHAYELLAMTLLMLHQCPHLNRMSLCRGCTTKSTAATLSGRERRGNNNTLVVGGGTRACRTALLWKKENRPHVNSTGNFFLRKSPKFIGKV